MRRRRTGAWRHLLRRKSEVWYGCCGIGLERVAYYISTDMNCRAILSRQRRTELPIPASYGTKITAGALAATNAVARAAAVPTASLAPRYPANLLLAAAWRAGIRAVKQPWWRWARGPAGFQDGAWTKCYSSPLFSHLLSGACFASYPRIANLSYIFCAGAPYPSFAARYYAAAAAFTALRTGKTFRGVWRQNGWRRQTTRGGDRRRAAATILSHRARVAVC